MHQNGTSRLQKKLHDRVEAVRREAQNVSGTAKLIANLCAEVLESGGAPELQKHVAFLTGALARMQKDLGVIEHFGSEGVRVRPPSQLLTQKPRDTK